MMNELTLGLTAQHCLCICDLCSHSLLGHFGIVQERQLEIQQPHTLDEGRAVCESIRTALQEM